MKTVICLIMFAVLLVGSEARKPRKQKIHPAAAASFDDPFAFLDDPLWEFSTVSYWNGPYQGVWPYEDADGYIIIWGPSLGEGLVIKPTGQNPKATMHFLVDALAN